MSFLLALAFVLSAVSLFVAPGVQAGVHGLALVLALHAPVAGVMVLALLAGIAGSFGLALAMLAFLAIWHITGFKLSVWRLQALIDTEKGPDHV